MCKCGLFTCASVPLPAKPNSSAAAEEVKASNVEQPVAVCTSADGKPPARITWQSKLSGTATDELTNNPDGTVTVTSRYNLIPTKEANEQQITCLVEHVALPQAESFPVQLSILCEWSGVLRLWGTKRACPWSLFLD